MIPKLQTLQSSGTNWEVKVSLVVPFRYQWLLQCLKLEESVEMQQLLRARLQCPAAHTGPRDLTV